MTNYHSDFLGGVLIGIAAFWGVIALFGNKPLLKRFPWILDFMPFLDPTGGMHSGPKELTATYLAGHTFKIVDVAYDGKISGRHFENCEIHGPAVLVMKGFGSVVECTFGVRDIEMVFLEYDRDRWIVGPIQVTECTFKRCRFVGIGLLGPQAEQARFLAGYGKPMKPPDSDTKDFSKPTE